MHPANPRTSSSLLVPTLKHPADSRPQESMPSTHLLCIYFYETHTTCCSYSRINCSRSTSAHTVFSGEQFLLVWLAELQCHLHEKFPCSPILRQTWRNPAFTNRGEKSELLHTVSIHGCRSQDTSQQAGKQTARCRHRRFPGGHIFYGNLETKGEKP